MKRLDFEAMTSPICARVPSQAPQEVADLVEQCRAVEPSARPTADQLVRQLDALQTSGKFTLNLQYKF